MVHFSCWRGGAGQTQKTCLYGTCFVFSGCGGSGSRKTRKHAHVGHIFVVFCGCGGGGSNRTQKPCPCGHGFRVRSDKVEEEQPRMKTRTVFWCLSCRGAEHKKHAIWWRIFCVQMKGKPASNKRASTWT